jgi:hypothetical protein
VLSVLRLSSKFVSFRLLITSNAYAAFQTQLQFSLLRPPVQLIISTGILTCFPSTTPFGLILGPDSLYMDEPSGETLRFSGHWILTNVFVTQPNILTCITSTLAYAKTSPAIQRSPTDHEYIKYNVFKNLTASADYLVPAIVGAKTLY